MKPFRRTGSNVPLHCPLPKCRARGSWGTFPHACFSCFVLFASSKENEVASAKPTSLCQNDFVNFPVKLAFLITLTREEELVRAQAARALPFPFGRKRKQKGPFRTARRQQKDRDTLKPVRRDAQKLAASRRSNNLCARFFTARDAMKKSPHEPRSEQSAMLPWPSGSGYADEGRV